MHYRTTGQGVPLVLLHANPGDSLDFQAVLPTLAREYQVIALDWPGYGESAAPNSSVVVDVAFFLNIVREVLDRLALPPALFIGNSLGGMVGAQLAIASPAAVRGLVLVSPGGFTPRGIVMRLFCTLQSSRVSFPPRVFARWYLKHRTPTVAAMLERARTVQTTPASIRVNRAIWYSFLDEANNLHVRARAIRAPTLLLFGRDDPVVRARPDGNIAAQAIAHARLVVLPSEHAPFAEIPERFLAETLPFLAQYTHDA